MMPDPSEKTPICRVHGRTDVGKVRRDNEDAFAVVDLGEGEVRVQDGAIAIERSARGVLLLVSDGMGGANAGEVASRATVESVRDALVATTASSPEVALCLAIDEANGRVHELAAVPGREGMGATLVAVLVAHGHAFIAEIGDSRAYVFRGGRLCQITKDQTFVQALLDAGALEPDEARRSEARNVILQAMGLTSSVFVALHRLELREGDRLLLCTDGLSSYVSHEVIEATLRVVAAPAEATRDLVMLANEGGGTDNVTVLVCDVSGALPAPRMDEDVTATLLTLRPFPFHGTASG